MDARATSRALPDAAAQPVRCPTWVPLLTKTTCTACTAGLQLDPFNLDLKAALQRANQAVLRDLAEGRGRQTRAIEYPEPQQRISYHP